MYLVALVVGIVEYLEVVAGIIEPVGDLVVELLQQCQRELGAQQLHTVEIVERLQLLGDVWIVGFLHCVISQNI